MSKSFWRIKKSSQRSIRVNTFRLEQKNHDWVWFERLCVRGSPVSEKKNDVMRFVAYFFKTLLPVECNYEIYNKKLLAIIRCFEEWRPELQSMHESIRVRIDHKALKYFMTIKKLNRKQTKWAEFLVDFNFVISYQVERIHGKTDSLIRKFGDKFVSKKNDRQKHQMQIFFISNRLKKQIKIKMNDFEIINVADVTEKTNDSNDRMSVKFDAFEISEKVFVPENKKFDIIKKIHDQSTAGHLGERRTLQIIQKFFEWSKMRADVERYVRNCHVCRRSKAPKNGYHGELQPIESENRPW